MALLQFGTTLVFGVPPLWNNENQPNPDVRKFQAVLGMTSISLTSFLALYLESPYHERPSRIHVPVNLFFFKSSFVVELFISWFEEFAGLYPVRSYEVKRRRLPFGIYYQHVVPPLDSLIFWTIKF